MDIRRRLISSSVEVNENWPNYFTIEALEDGLTASLSGNGNSIEYCIDKSGNWVNLSEGQLTSSINAGQVVQFRGDYSNMTFGGTDAEGYQKGIGTFNISKKCKLSGNIMSLLYKENFEDELSLPENNTFSVMFLNQVNIINVDEDLLPATTLKSYSYYNMFAGCNNLENAPKLPCTNLSNLDSVYCGMFYDCTKLTVAPELPSTSLGPTCYAGMFGATGIISMPELPATTLTTYCYQAMFRDCKSLVTVVDLPATTLNTYCYYGMFDGCTSLTTVQERLPATTLQNYCYQQMYYGCTSITTAPVLPSTGLKTRCYHEMFYGCSKLNYIKMMSTTRLSTSYSSNWVYGVASSGTFVRNSKRSHSTGTSGIPSGWTQQTASS